MRPLLTLAALALFMSGCRGKCDGVQCGPCAVPLSVRLIDASTDGGVPNAQLSGLVGLCADSRCAVDIQAGKPPAGTYEFDIVAEGFKTVHRSEVVAADSSPPDACCRCGYEPRILTVPMERE